MIIVVASFGTTFKEQSALSKVQAELEKTAPLGVSVHHCYPASTPHPDAKWYDNRDWAYLEILWERPVNIDELVEFLEPHLRNKQVTFEAPEDSGSFIRIGFFSKEALLQIGDKLGRSLSPEVDLELPGAARFTEYLKSRAAGKWTMQRSPRGHDPLLLECFDTETWRVKLDGVRIGKYQIACRGVAGIDYACYYFGLIPGYVDAETAAYLKDNPDSRRRVDEVLMHHRGRFPPGTILNDVPSSLFGDHKYYDDIPFP